jgi:signal transduction histidine kinase
LGDIFDPYFTTKPDGNGLGLWIAQQIAVAHGGNLRAENAPAGGAIFLLTLPLNRKE